MNARLAATGVLAALAACGGEGPLSGLQSSHRLPGNAMAPTLLAGDWFLVNRTAYVFGEPERGDVVLFWVAEEEGSTFPVDERPDALRSHYVMRIVGVPGDVIELRRQRVSLDGVELPLEPTGRALELAAQPAKPIYVETFGEERHEVAFADGQDDSGRANGTFRIPEGRYFLLGDQRDDSRDSRFWGTVRREHILGRATRIYFSWDADGSRVRWDRIGDSIE